MFRGVLILQATIQALHQFSHDSVGKILTMNSWQIPGNISTSQIVVEIMPTLIGLIHVAILGMILLLFHVTIYPFQVCRNKNCDSQFGGPQNRITEITESLPNRQLWIPHKCICRRAKIDVL
jgi:hypothetical protein